MTRTLLAALVALAFPLGATAQTVSYFNFTDDATSQINSAKSYTSAVDFGAVGGAPTINGVGFTKVGTGGSGGNVAITPTTSLTAESGLSSNGGATPFGTIGASGSVATLLNDFLYSGPGAGNPTVRTVTLSGLTVGQTYSLRVYARPWGDSAFPDRATDIQFGTAASFRLNEDNVPTSPGAAGLVRNQAYALVIDYTATAATQSVTFTPIADPATFHFYGLTNELTPVPEPATVLAAGLGLGGVGLLRRRRRQ